MLCVIFIILSAFHGNINTSHNITINCPETSTICMYHDEDIFVYFMINNFGIVLGSQLETFSTGNMIHMQR